MAQGSKIVMGLSLKPAKKKPVLNSSLAADTSNADAVPVDYIKGVTEKTIASTAEAPGAKPVFVIPLTTNPWKAAVNAGDDTEAVAAILAGVHAPAEAEAPTVAAIPMLAPAGDTDSSGAAEPLLKAAMVPGLADLHDDDAKFKHDLAQRAANIDASSTCYSAVPISAFGEALLRGMGWDGSRLLEAEQAESQARPKRLGLGAKVRPPSPPAKQRTRKPGEQKAVEDSTWAKEAARKVAAQKLHPGDIVWLRDPRFVKKAGVTRAQVARTSGVPGLNAVEVALEESGELVSLNRDDAIAVPSDELEAKPFRAARKRDRHEDTAPSGGTKKARDDASTREWILPAIRVRILEKGPHCGLKGDILNVRDGRATVTLDGGTKAGAFSQRHLETVVPSVGDAVVVLRGPLRARQGPVLKKDRGREEVCVEFDGRREYFRFDHVSAAAPRSAR